MTTLRTNPPRIFSFFAGAGFLDLGFDHEGFETCFVNEWHRPFLHGYLHSRRKLGIVTPRHGYSMSSVEALSTDEKFLSAFRSERASNGLIGFIGGPPCPDFSVGGKNRGSIGENGKLSKSYEELVLKMRPDFFLFENVKGLYRTKKHREFFEGMKARLSAHFHLQEKLVNAIEYGAPQDRERIILVGFLKGVFNSREFDWGNLRYPARSAFDFQWPTTDPFQQNTKILNPKNIPLELTTQYWFDRNNVTAHPNAEHCFTPRAGLKKFLTIAEGDDSKKSYKRLHRWRYSPTAAYGNNEVHLHPYLARRISVSEALAIQSLPKEFELPTTMTLTDMFKTVGNGVPYLAAKGLAKAIYRHLEFKDEVDRSKSGQNDKATAA